MDRSDLDSRELVGGPQMLITDQQSKLNRENLEKLENLIVPERMVRITFFLDVSTTVLHEEITNVGSLEDAVQETIASGGYIISHVELADEYGGTDER